MPMHNPPHPGEVIRTEIVEANGLTVTDAAKASCPFGTPAKLKNSGQRGCAEPTFGRF